MGQRKLRMLLCGSTHAYHTQDERERERGKELRKEEGERRELSIDQEGRKRQTAFLVQCCWRQREDRLLNPYLSLWVFFLCWMSLAHTDEDNWNDGSEFMEMSRVGTAEALRAIWFNLYSLRGIEGIVLWSYFTGWAFGHKMSNDCRQPRQPINTGSLWNEWTWDLLLSSAQLNSVSYLKCYPGPCFAILRLQMVFLS